MQYAIVFCVVFTMVGLRAFMQKVVNANQYPLMGFLGGMIYMAEGTAVILITRGGWWNVVAGAFGAGCGVIIAVYTYNKYCTNLFKKKVEVTDVA